MSLAPRLDLRQSQSLVMTPQLQQAIKLLALSNLEIETFLAEEIEKNPLLTAGTEERDVPSAESDTSPESELPDEPRTADHLIQAGDAAADAPLDVDYAEETFHHDSALDSGGQNGALPDDGFDFDNVAAGNISLRDHLVRQAGERLNGSDLLIAHRIIDAIDDAGYLTEALEDLARQLGVEERQADAILVVVQSFDPSGVGARTLSECLAIQAREADRYDPCMAALLDHLDLLARGALPQLRRICGVDDEDLADMIRELRNYDPKPGLKFGGEPATPVQPDIFVARSRTGWQIELNSATLPRVLVDRRYHAQLSAGAANRQSKAWVADCLASANWLVKALDQRARTIIKVSTEIVKQQEGFFVQGVSHLRPLTLKTVADAIGMHESTVSRVTSNKYLSCERGFYELKYFFTSGVAGADGGDAVSAEAVKNQIARLIADEGDDILSDDKLVELLNAKGFGLARRTVAKYREAIGLGSSVQRRRARALSR